MINNIIVSDINSASKKSFLDKFNINYIISFLDPEYLNSFYLNYLFNVGVPKDKWEYFILYDVSHRTKYIEYPGPQRSHVERLIKIFKELIAREEKINILCHCTAGISRSTAASLILLYLIHKDEKVALKKLLEIRSIANPNILILEFADEILGSGLSEYIRNYKYD